MQASSDIFLGWKNAKGFDGSDYYVRQLWDWKISVDVEAMKPDELLVYGKMCAWTLPAPTLAPATALRLTHTLARAIITDKALAEFAVAYANQNERDYQALAAAVESGRIVAESGI